MSWGMPQVNGRLHCLNENILSKSSGVEISVDKKNMRRERTLGKCLLPSLYNHRFSGIAFFVIVFLKALLDR